MFTHLLFWAGKQGNHQNFDPSMLPKKLLTDFHVNEAKTKIVFRIFFQNGSKSEIFKTTNSENSENLNTYFVGKFIHYQLSKP